ncbi:MAG TPA: magnesium transporter CorA family protein [Spirochaetales bacterium]|nr:magnesium transporter CorA family protein [Spirochaetales bacterium]
MTVNRIKGAAGLAVAPAPAADTWIDIRGATPEELAWLERECKVNPEHLADIMDLDEQARIEKEDEYTLLILRLPVYDARLELPYYTVPLGVLLFPDRIVTICQTDCELLGELSSGRAKHLDPANKAAFLLHILGRAAIVYLRYLKDINRRTAAIERELQRSVKNHELTLLLAFEKSLVFFTTSLKSNEILLEKLQATRALRFKEDEAELLEDVLTDNKQAIEMANIYSDILSGMMDAFASVISNNLNMQMKRLTVISIVLMIPTLVVSMFGMNVRVPLEDRPGAFYIISAICVLAGLLGALLLRDRRKGAKTKLLLARGNAVALPAAAPRRRAGR